MIHTVGPNWHRGQRDPDLLRRCFTRSLDVAAELGARSVAFPAVSAGVYGWDPAVVADIAVDAALRRSTGTACELVRFVLFGDAVCTSSPALHRSRGRPGRLGRERHGTQQPARARTRADPVLPAVAGGVDVDRRRGAPRPRRRLLHGPRHHLRPLRLVAGRGPRHRRRRDAGSPQVDDEPQHRRARAPRPGHARAVRRGRPGPAAHHHRARSDLAGRGDQRRAARGSRRSSIAGPSPTSATSRGCSASSTTTWPPTPGISLPWSTFTAIVACNNQSEPCHDRQRTRRPGDRRRPVRTDPDGALLLPPAPRAARVRPGSPSPSSSACTTSPAARATSRARSASRRRPSPGRSPPSSPSATSSASPTRPTRGRRSCHSRPPASSSSPSSTASTPAGSPPSSTAGTTPRRARSSRA